MALSATSTSLVVLCLVSLLLVASFADDTSAGAHDAGRSMQSGAVVDARSGQHQHTVHRLTAHMVGLVGLD
ncbi:hypothetical protein PAHAL_6G088100 [Panicum hallii]|uniref:Uncharacterized protein n=1 Tax=Panicum hallii TaxID=206008 RepID=A0A2T8IFQ7_9POAL|nr:hypothetical protein PAHAL_6G088100 [Panicum hallii]